MRLSKTTLRVLSATLLLLLVARSSPLAAQTSKGGQDPEVDKLYRSGHALIARKDYKGALDKFLAVKARKQKPSTELLLDIGKVYEFLGDLISARAEYEAATNIILGPKDIQSRHDAQRKARDKLIDVQQRIPAIEIDATEVSTGLQIFIINDNISQPIPANLLVKPIPKNPGVYSIMAIREGLWTYVGPFNLQEQSHKRFTAYLDDRGIRLRDRDGGYSTPAEQAAGLEALKDRSRVPAHERRDKSEASSRSLRPGVVALGVGGASMFLGILTAIAPSGLDHVNSKKWAIYLVDASSGILLVTGITGIAIGVCLELGRKPTQSPKNNSVALRVGPGSLAVTGTF